MMTITRFIVLLLCVFLLTSCQTVRRLARHEHADNCYPGTRCYEHLSAAQKAAHRQKWVMHRQDMLNNTTYRRQYVNWAVRPLSSY